MLSYVLQTKQLIYGMSLWGYSKIVVLLESRSRSISDTAVAERLVSIVRMSNTQQTGFEQVISIRICNKLDAQTHRRNKQEAADAMTKTSGRFWQVHSRDSPPGP